MICFHINSFSFSLPMCLLSFPSSSFLRVLLCDVTEYLRRLSSRIRLLLTPGSIQSLTASQQETMDHMDTEDAQSAGSQGPAVNNSLSSFPLEFEVAGRGLLVVAETTSNVTFYFRFLWLIVLLLFACVM